MSVVKFQKPQKPEASPSIMVDFTIEWKKGGISGRLPILEAIEKLEEAADLLRAELKAEEQP